MRGAKYSAPTGNGKKVSSSWAGQHAWLLLNSFPFPVGQTIYAHCTVGGVLYTLHKLCFTMIDCAKFE